jgi:hypothetical protein
MVLKRKQQIAALQTAEHGAVITIVTCPAGHLIPPLVIFPRINMKLQLVLDIPPGTIYACQPSVWIQTDIFRDWLHHFISSVKCTAEDPVILVLDSHSLHIRNADAINIE